MTINAIAENFVGVKKMYHNVAPNFNAAIFWSLAFNKFGEHNNFEGKFLRYYNTLES